MERKRDEIWRNSMIELTDLCFAYEKRPVLKHVTVNISQGEAVLLSGPNGCGKTTLLKIINGLLFSEIGTYRYKGKEITKSALKQNDFCKWFHKEIGFVFQDSNVQLFCNNVEEEIAFGPNQLGLPEGEAKRRVDDMIRLFDLDKLRERAPYHLSTGEKKKVAIASVLAVNPEVIVLDEPFSGLDEATQNILATLLVELKKAGKTLIITSHEKWMDKELLPRKILL